MGQRSLLAWAFTVTLVGATAAPTSPPAAPQPPIRPNIVFVLTDDLDTEYPRGSWIDHFPKLRALLADQGATFTNYFVSLSLCCPSRSSMLRGQYAHNTQIFTNTQPGGGFQKAHDLGLEASTIATWLHAAGYRTVLLGKYLNGYPGTLGKGYVPPGWDEWYGGERNAYGQFNYDLNENGKIVHYGNAPSDYLQDVIRSKATAFIRHAASEQQPFFMWMATFTPHMPATSAPRHAQAFPRDQAPRPPTFNEEDVGSHPQWLANRPRLTSAQIAQIDTTYRKRLRSMLAVEDTIDGLVQTLRAAGVLDRTYIIFTSDNGFHLGQHRLPPGKNTEFEEDLHVPLLVRGPGIPAGAVVSQLAVNIDLAPTFAELAGVAVPPFVDGRSLVPLLRAPRPPEQWRRALLLEHGVVKTGDVGRTPSGRDTVEPPDPLDLSRHQLPHPFQGLHTQRLVYIEYPATRERELYDLSADPYEHHSVAQSADQLVQKQLSEWLEKLRACAGPACRAAEDAPPCEPRHDCVILQDRP